MPSDVSRRSRLLLAAVLVVLGASGCSKARCTAQIADGKATYAGTAEGRRGQPQLDREAIRDACRQRCAAEKAAMLDACAGRCLADVDGAKIGAKINCSDR